MLDESAIEAMIARQREVMNRRHEPAPSVRTVQTDEFEVYERPSDPAPAPAAPAAPQAPPAPEPEEFEVFERQSPQPEPVRNPLPPQPVPHPEPTPGPTPTPGPEPTPQAPQPSTEQTRPFAPQPTRRPEVWPPLGTRDAALAPAASTPAPTPSAPTHPAVAATPPEPDVTPRSHAPAAPAAAPAPPTPARSDAPATTGHAFPDLSGTTTGTGGDTPRLAIVQALFNEEITGDMLGLARQKAEKLGAPVVHHVTVPGVYDLPLAVQTLLRRDDVDACVVLGCVVTGETRHDEVITHATAKSLQEVALATGKPVGFGVIGPGMTWKQAEARVSSGKHAVEAAVAQWRVLRGLTA